MPSLENLHRNLRDKPFSLLAIDVGESREAVRQFVEDRNLSFTFLLDEDTKLSGQYGVGSHPMKFLIDKDGTLRGLYIGYREWDTAEMQSLIDAMMNAK